MPLLDNSKLASLLRIGILIWRGKDAAERTQTAGNEAIAKAKTATASPSSTKACASSESHSEIAPYGII
ncbi:MAG: hypothetical protein MZU91_08855 [Desulfosudis oleivorans]|nr:hypothetical protein [Desulfosudis oleivorans]